MRALLSCPLRPILASVLWLGMASCMAQPATELLERARQAIASQALQSSTRVDALSWVDTEGRLQEFMAFRQAADVAPVQTGRQPGKPAIRDLLHPVTAQQATAPACAPHPLRSLLSLQTRWSGRAQDSLRHGVQEQIDAAWLSAAQERAWAMLPSLQPDPQASLYDRLLINPVPFSGTLDAQLSLQTPTVPVGQATRLTMHLRVQTADRRVLLESRTELSLPMEPSAWGAPHWSGSAWTSVRQHLDHWAEALDQKLACERPEPQVLDHESGLWVLNMGEMAGLHTGQDWILVNPNRLPERSLEPGALEQMVVARVVALDARRAKLQLVAGDARAPRPGWVARPLPSTQAMAHLAPIQHFDAPALTR